MEQDQQAAVLALGIGDRHHLEPQAAPARARVHGAVLDHASVLLERAEDGTPEIGVQLGPCEAQDVEARSAGQRFQVRPGAAAEMQDLQPFVDHDAGRPVHLEDLAIRELSDVLRRTLRHPQVVRLGRRVSRDRSVEAGL